MKGTAKSQITKYRITIRKPNTSGRKTFGLVKDIINGDTRNQSTLDIPELDAINERFINKEIAMDVTLRLVTELKERELEKYNGPDTDKAKTFHKDNHKFVNKLLEEAGSKNIKKVSYVNTKIDFDRLLNLLVDTSIMTIRKVDLKDLMDNCTYSASVKNKLVCRLNLMLKMAGRDFLISKYPIEKHEISHITEKELNTLLKSVDVLKMADSKFIQDAITVMFYTGLREGELFAVSSKHYKNTTRTYTVSNQYTRDGNQQSKPKTGKVRSIVIPKKAVESFTRLIDYESFLKTYYRMRLTKRITRAAKFAFPNEKSKHISCHDLRHSFAIWSLGKGLSLTQVAFLLGNTLAVCQQHYTGYILSDEAMDAISKRLG